MPILDCVVRGRLSTGKNSELFEHRSWKDDNKWNDVWTKVEYVAGYLHQTLLEPKDWSMEIAVLISTHTPPSNMYKHYFILICL